MSGARARPKKESTSAPEQNSKSSAPVADAVSPEEMELNEALKLVQKAGKDAVKYDIRSDVEKRNFCYAVYDLVTKGIPEITQKDSPLRRESLRGHNSGGVPPAFLDWLKKHDLPPPSFKSDNIILPLFKNLWHSAQRDTAAYVDPFEGATVAEKPTDEAFAAMIPTHETQVSVQEIGAETKSKSADKVMYGRYARLVMAALDMGQREVISYAFRWLDTGYKPWVANPDNKSLIRRPETEAPATPKPPTDTGGTATEGDTTEEDEVEEDATEADDGDESNDVLKARHKELNGDAPPVPPAGDTPTIVANPDPDDLFLFEMKKGSDFASLWDTIEKKVAPKLKPKQAARFSGIYQDGVMQIKWL